MPDSRFPPDFFLSFFESHPALYQLFYSLVLWDRPLFLILLLIPVELFSLLVYLFDFGFLSAACLAGGFCHIFWFTWHYFGLGNSAILFAETEQVPPAQFPYLESLCEWLSFLISYASEVVVFYAGQNATGDPFSILSTAAFFCALFMIFSGIGTFWFLWTSAHIVLIGPGVVANCGNLLDPGTYLALLTKITSRRARESGNE
jgi:hypothetical protein